MLLVVLAASALGFALGPRGAAGPCGLLAVLSAALLAGGGITARRYGSPTAQLIEDARRDPEVDPALDEEAWLKARERYGRS